MNYPLPSDESKVTVLQLATAVNRDEYAYRQLFLLFYKPALLFVSNILHSEELAEEIYSDVLLKIWQMESRLQQVSNYKQYLFTALRNASFNELKKQKKFQIIALEENATDHLPVTSPEETLLNGEFSSKIKSAIAALPLQCQLVYRLIKEEGFNYKQTADIMDLSVNTIERHMNNALKKIVVALKPYLSV
ncbi:sigma-70 family RNA polymerase sigma factor [Filimonas lacunae]|uniref:sigma-70 family RNA polymerase sigma factor n=1 Tax=Filimonas lacunae TaxID=477680 RepID=UPI0007D7261D|nr:sigma-70 family RNA polymerase sigma factor [Filimonas lacunae]BAV07813.1 RNA polymerase ECF-type sigma factor [Filimonas lacunae]